MVIIYSCLGSNSDKVLKFHTTDTSYLEITRPLLSAKIQ